MDVRLAYYDAHRAFVADPSAYGVVIIMSGPLTSDDGATMIRNLFLVEAPTGQWSAFQSGGPLP